MWETIYNLLLSIIGTGSSYEWGAYTCEVVATLLCLFVFAIPVIVVVCTIRLIYNAISR